jgi:hypothetical protein
MKKDSKQRLFEVMGKLDKTFKPKLNENRENFKRLTVFLMYNKEGMYLGDLDPIDEMERGSEFYEGTKAEVLATPEFQKFAQEKNITAEQVGKITRGYEYTMNGQPLETEYYAPSQSEELYDKKTNTWYNLSGQQMRDPSEYDKRGDGYTPFGDEGDGMDEDLGFDKQSKLKGNFRAEVTGMGENVWSTNAIEYNTEEEAKKWLDNLSGRWFGYDMSRVVPSSVPKGQPVDMENDIIYQNFRK